MRVLGRVGSFLGVALVTTGVTVGLILALSGFRPTTVEAHDPVLWPVATLERTISKPSDPVKRITVVAVGDMMVHSPQLQSASTGSGYDFSGCFAPVGERVAEADLAIGNLETVLAGSERGYTGYPTFNSPDAYAEAAVASGFDILTTANNHTLDRGPAGLAATLEVLDRLGALHTGTARTKEESERVLVIEVEGVQVAVLAYTYGMNGFTAPEDKPWMVNTIDQAAMEDDVRAARALGVDLVIVSIHNGVEYQRQPSASQETVEKAIIEAGADVVLGSHPHVIQPMETVEATRADGSPRTGFIIHSLGNFLSNQRERFRDTGIMLRFVFEKNLRSGVTTLVSVEYVPVWVDDTLQDDEAGHRVLPIGDVLADPIYPGITEPEREKLRQAWEDTTSHLGSLEVVSDDPGAKVFYQAPL